MKEAGQRLSAGWSLRTWAAIAAGTMATWGMAMVGLGSLQRLFEHDRDSLSSLFDRSYEASLESTEFFSAPVVGYGGEPPVVAFEFLNLLGDLEGEEKLADLAARGASGGRLYGLCGLKILGSKRLELAEAVARSDHRPVALTASCSISMTTAAETVRSGKLDTMCGWWAETYRSARQTAGTE